MSHTLQIDHAAAAAFPALSNDDRVAIKRAILAHANGKPLLRQYGLALRFAKHGELATLCSMLGLNASVILHNAAVARAANMILQGGSPSAPVSPAGACPASVSTPSAEEREIDMEGEPEAEPAMANLDATPAPASILAPFAEVLHPALAAKIDAAISAAISTAEEKARQEATPAPRAVAAAASRAAVSTLGAVFGLKGNSPWLGLPVQTWTPDPSTPDVDPSYVFDPEILGPVMASIERGSSPWLVGPKGSGKTEMMEQIAARTGRPFARIGCADDMDKYALIGQRTPDGSGAFVMTYGIYSKAAQTPGCILLLDEPSAAKPGSLFVFQTSMDRRALYVEETGEKIAFADGFLVCAADNTDGHGDDSNNYAGTSALNHAFLDRFPRKVLMATPARAMLTSIIGKRTGLASAAADMLAGVIKASEAMANKGDLSATLSLRPVLEFAKDVQANLPLPACVETTLLRNLPAAEAQAVRQHVLANLDLTALAIAAGHGKPGAAAVKPSGVVSPAGAKAKSDFGL